MSTLKIGTRASKLALFQASFLQKKLSEFPIKSEIIEIKTEGDKDLKKSFDKFEGKGIFTKELDLALIEGQVDLAIHSYKDLPTEIHPKLQVACVFEREDPADLLIIHPSAVDYKQDFLLKPFAKVGTSSNRRRSQILSLRQDLSVEALRGNVETRVRKLKEGLYDAILIAKSGVERLQIDLSEFETYVFKKEEFIPAAGQGALAVVICKENEKLKDILAKLNDRETEETTKVEKDLLDFFGGGCHMPLGAFCKKEDSLFVLHASYATSGKDFAYRFACRDENPKNLLTASLQKLKAPQCNFKSLFISKKIEENRYLARFLKQQKISFRTESLIETKKIDLEAELKIKDFDIIFFPSPNAVSYFYECFKEIPQSLKVFTMGLGTTTALQKFGRKADFVGEGNDPIHIGQEWKALVKDKKVLIPCAQKSSDNILKVIEPVCEVQKLPVYETLLRQDIKEATEDILIFTSPSNVKAYFAEHKIQAHQKILAMGKTTQKSLEQFGCKSTLPLQSNELGIAEVLLSF